MSAPLEVPAAEPCVTSEGRILPGGSLLDKLSLEDRTSLFALGRSRVFDAGEEVVRQGTVGDCLFVVEDGELVVARCVPGNEEEILLTVTSGTLLGELAILDGGARAASLRAVRRSVLRVISLGAFEALTLHGGEAGHRILRTVTAYMHERLQVTRQVAAARLAAPRARIGRGPCLDWWPPHEMLAVLPVFPAFREFDRQELEAMLPHMSVVAVGRLHDVVLPESAPAHPGVVMVLRGALSPWLEDGQGPEMTMPAVGPGGFADYAAALGFADEPHRWRARSPTQLLRLDRVLFEPDTAQSARLLYALSRWLGGSVRRTTGLSMHFSMAWR
jgi:CRP-like cAMP-binding protein